MEVNIVTKDLLSNLMLCFILPYSVSLPCVLQEKKLVAEIKKEAKTGNEVSKFSIYNYVIHKY
jgi:hypothetical protein